MKILIRPVASYANAECKYEVEDRSNQHQFRTVNFTDVIGTFVANLDQV